NFTVTNVETIDVTNLATGNTLRADESRNDWFVNADNSGTIRDLDTGATVTFSNIAHLAGNSDADTFNINAAIVSINAGAGSNNVIVNGSISGTLIAGAGNDIININAAGTAASINVGNGTNNITVAGNATDLTGGTGTDTITVTGNVNAIDAGNGTNSITVAGNATDLTGGTDIDTITVTGNVNAVDTDDGNDNINISGTVAGVIDGGSGIADLLTIVRTGDQTVQLGDSRVGDENYTVTNIETINAAGTSGNTLGNTLIADAGPNTWDINGNNSGFVTDDESAATTAFSGFSNLTGNNANDSFTISNPGGNIDGLINGMGGNDSVDITMPGHMTVQLGNRVDESMLNVFQVEEITANSGYINTLRGDDTADLANAIDYNWVITGDNSGVVTYDGETTVFTNFNNLYGGTAVDQFTVTAGSLNLIDMGEGNDFFSISGGAITTVDGNAGDDTFTLSGGAVTNLIGGDGTDFIVDTSPVVNITVGAGNDVDGFEGITAQNGNGIINAQDGVLSDWVISGTNTGQVSDNTGQNLAFSGFSTINGGSGVDNFTVNINGSISGTVSGNGDNDTLTIDLPDNTLRTSSGQINFEGGSGNDVITITGASGIYAETYNPAYTAEMVTYDQLAYDNGNGVTFDVNYREAETVNSNIATTRLTINSVGNADVIELGSTVFGTNSGAVTVNYAAGSKNNISLLALNGSDVKLTGNVTVPGELRITADEITQSDSITLTANSLTLDAINQAGTADNRLTTNVNELAIINHSGTFFIDEQNDITLTEISSTAGNIDIAAAGSIISTANLQSGGTFTLDATNSIDLSGQNQFSGATIFTAADSITLGNANTFANTVNMTAANNMTFGGNIATASMMTLNAANIDFTGQNQFSGPIVFTATESILFSSNNTFSDTVNITSTNDITFTENLIATSPMVLSAGNNINVSGANNQLNGELTLSGTTININNTVATTLASVTAQNLTINSTGDITDTGVILVQNGNMAGVTTLTSTEGSITLDNVGNNFDRVNLTAANDVTLLETDGIVLDSIVLTDTTFGGAVNVTANNGLAANDTAIGDIGLGNITATAINLNASEGAIVDRSSRLTADTVTLAAASGIGNSNAINTVTPTLSVINASFDGIDTIPGVVTVNTTMTSGAININNTGDVTIDDLRNYGDISVTSAGNITLSITSNSGAIDANYGGDISDPVYAGDVTILGAGGSNFSTMGVGTLSGNADIIAESLRVENVSRFGTQTSPIGLRVNNDFTLLANQGTIYYLGGRPRTVTTTADLLQLAIQGFTGISSQQLIEIETLGEIDQAIFTEVRNYNYDDVAILLPADQRYGNNDEMEEGGQNEE
ncbi:MAG: hypothetical protein L3J98_14850, partial [Gammaproteobacteria bacterium]|nr:hypothetical protein [Gammaproteobacteria bacterium]